MPARKEPRSHRSDDRGKTGSRSVAERRPRPGSLRERNSQNQAVLLAKPKTTGRQWSDIRALGYIGTGHNYRAGHVCFVTPQQQRRAFCPIEPERSMSVTIWPPIVQLPFGLGNLNWAQ